MKEKEEVLTKIIYADDVTVNRILNILNNKNSIQNQEQSEKYMTMKEVESFTKIGRSTILRACGNGKIHKYQHNGFNSKMLFKYSEIQNWINGN